MHWQIHVHGHKWWQIKFLWTLRHVVSPRHAVLGSTVPMINCQLTGSELPFLLSNKSMLYVCIDQMTVKCPKSQKEKERKKKQFTILMCNQVNEQMVKKMKQREIRILKKKHRNNRLLSKIDRVINSQCARLLIHKNQR